MERKSKIKVTRCERPSECAVLRDLLAWGRDADLDRLAEDVKTLAEVESWALDEAGRLGVVWDDSGYERSAIDEYPEWVTATRFQTVCDYLADDGNLGDECDVD